MEGGGQRVSVSVKSEDIVREVFWVSGGGRMRMGLGRTVIMAASRNLNKRLYTPVYVLPSLPQLAPTTTTTSRNLSHHEY